MARKPMLPVPAEPGVWRRDGYLPGDPGTFAFVVGVSDYTHLDESDESLTLGKLFVSALTAYRFFRYLVDDYTFESAPLAECVLLLAPTADEIPFLTSDPQYAVTAQNAPVPTFQKMFESLKLWRARLTSPALSAADAATSRTIFFFSGHGLEIDVDEQLLLPSDYLAIPGDYNNAINAFKLYRGMGSVPIPDQFYFIDACRNDIAALHDLSDAEGVAPFTIQRTRYDRAAPILHATSSGNYAFQPTVPGPDTMSFFGGAVIDALRVTSTAKPVFQPDWTTTPGSVRFFPLYTYVNQAVSQRLQAANRAANDPVSASGAVKDRVIAQVQRPVQELSSFEDMQRQAQDKAVRLGDTTATFVEWLRNGPAAAAEPPPVQRYPLGRVPLATLGAIPEIAPPIASFFAGLVPFAWYYAGPDSGTWEQSSDMPFAVELEVAGAGHRVTVHFACSGSDSWRWMQGRAADRSFAFLFPGSRIENPTYTLEFALDTAEGYPVIVDVRANLSELNAGNLGIAAKLWATYRETSAIGAHDEVMRQASELRGIAATDIAAAADVLFQKGTSPLAATVAALILRRAGQDDPSTREWLTNLALEYSESSDAAVLALEQRASSEEHPDPALTERLFAQARAFGTPCTADATGLMLRMLRSARHREDAVYPDDYFIAMGRSGFTSAFAPLVGEYQAFRPGGLFTSFVGRSNEMPRIRSRIW